MNTITFDEDIKLKKTHFKNIKEFNFSINFIWKTKKLSPIELIKKYHLDKKYIWKKTDFLLFLR